MRPRYYVHMGPRTADKVSLMWKGLHVILFTAIILSAFVATWCIYKILEIYNFHCILYAKITFEESYEERMGKNSSSISDEDPSNITTIASVETTTLNCAADPDNPNCLPNSENKTIGKRSILEERDSKRLPISEVDWRSYRTYNENMTNTSKEDNTGYLNLRKTAFSTIYMCDLMFFSPLASIIMAIFLGALTIVGGKGGAGNPGDLFPNPWICVYPFLGLCGFMIVFSFIARDLFFSGLNAFCKKYYTFTKHDRCCKEMDKYTKQFSTDSKSEQKYFYYNYLVGGIAVELTSALWVLQALVYIFRILCLADFTTYLTGIRRVTDKKNIQEPALSSIVSQVVDQAKVKNI